jgi:putative heme-binding domain-containing protein
VPLLSRSKSPVLILLTVTAAVVSGLVYSSASVASGSKASGFQREKLKDPAFIAEGARLFAPTCGTGYCHGAGGSGGGAPKIRGRDFEADEIFKSISNGVPGTAMPGFKSIHSEEQIWKLVAFVMSPVTSTPGSEVTPPVSSQSEPTPTKSAEPPRSTSASSAMAGDAKAGKALFFDSSKSRSCHACHSIDGVGAAIGPDLSKVGSRSARELVQAILLPGEAVDPRYVGVRLTLADGEKIVGIVREEDEQAIRIYDLTELPAVLRTVQKERVAKNDKLSESPMPGDYGNVYTMKQLLDLVTYLKSSDPQSKQPVTLKDLF